MSEFVLSFGALGSLPCHSVGPQLSCRLQIPIQKAVGMQIWTFWLKVAQFFSEEVVSRW